MNTIQTFDQMLAELTAIQEQVSTLLLPLSEKMLNYKPDVKAWSILECLEHLNRYSEYYNHALEKGIEKAKGSNAPKVYKLTWFGKKSIELVNPDNVKRHKTIARMNPSGSSLSKDTLQKFLVHQQKLEQLIRRAQEIDANQKRIPVEFLKLIKLNIYETLIFMLQHERRHLAQALRVQAALPSELSK